MLLRVDEAIEKSLGRQLATRPNLLTLLELYLAELEQRTMFASCFLVGETPSNVHRRSIRLAELGALTRQQGKDDHRRVDLKLTPSTRSAIENILDAARFLSQR
ncbi:helix-turn-helix domain-containing protein [Novosphingobium rosa]|uniref:hypothetical protein n=1 Tax=Novosphingobium rosa TaxID=76978 RepID=UPI00082C5B76|nr:hypothetical protein [Novosphingobium rosa]